MPGFRYDHYRLKPGAWFHLIEKRIAEAIAVRRLAERGLKLLEGEDPALKTRLEEMRGIYLFFEQELPALLEQWEQLQTAGQAEVEIVP